MNLNDLYNILNLAVLSLWLSDWYLIFSCAELPQRRKTTAVRCWDTARMAASVKASHPFLAWEFACRSLTVKKEKGFRATSLSMKRNLQQNPQVQGQTKEQSYIYDVHINQSNIRAWDSVVKELVSCSNFVLSTVGFLYTIIFLLHLLGSSSRKREMLDKKGLIWTKYWEEFVITGQNSVEK